MSQVVLIAVAALLLALGIAWGLWVLRQARASRAVVWTPAVEEAALRLASGWGMTSRSVRTLFGRRLVQAWGRRGRLTWQLEVCTSARGAYVRLIGQPDEGLDQGVRIMREASSGAMGWLWRLREVQLGEPEVDARLVLLARDEARLRVLMGTQLKAELMALEGQVDRLEIGDEGLFVHVDRVTTVEALGGLLRSSTAALERLDALSRAWGGLSQQASAAYGDAVKGDFNREEGATTLDAIELADPGSTTGKMAAVQAEGAGSAEAASAASTSAAASEAAATSGAGDGAARG
jgi:hypothetical protein